MRFRSAGMPTCPKNGTSRGRVVQWQINSSAELSDYHVIQSAKHGVGVRVLAVGPLQNEKVSTIINCEIEGGKYNCGYNSDKMNYVRLPANPHTSMTVTHFTDKSGAFHLNSSLKIDKASEGQPTTFWFQYDHEPDGCPLVRELTEFTVNLAGGEKLHFLRLWNFEVFSS